MRGRGPGFIESRDDSAPVARFGFAGVGRLASMRAENDVTDQSLTTLHTAPYDWPPGETAVPWSCASGAAFDFAIECGLGDRGSADLVAECVNGLLAQGAVPRTLAAVITGGDEAVDDLGLGIERACRAHAFTLVACTRKPGRRPSAMMLAHGARLRPLPGVAAGDVIYACGAPGLQGVGVEDAILLLRRAGSLDAVVADLGSTPRQALLAQHKTYLGVSYQPLGEDCWHALVPVGDGGLLGSLSSALPAGLGAELDFAGFEPSPLHAWLRAHSRMDRSALARAFNLGVGMLMIAPLRHAARVEAELQGWNEPHARVGRVVEGDGVLIAG